MAIMLETRTLRGKPVDGTAGPSLAIEVRQGARVELVSELPPRFVEIKALDLPDQPVGWVTAKAVDKTATDVPPIGNDEIAMVVATHAETFGVNAHFLLAYAHMRSAFKPGKMATGVEHGPFGLSEVEWAFYGNRADLGVEFPAAALEEWRSQSVVSAFRLMMVQNILTEKLGSLPNSTELVLSLACGPVPAAAALKNRAQKIGELLRPASATSPDWAGVDVGNISTRFTDLAADKSVDECLAAISTKLQASLDETRKMIEASGLASKSEDISDPQDPVPQFPDELTGKLIDITDMDIDALARVAKSEVGHFARHGEDQLEGGLKAVVDTIFNRVAHRLFPGSIQQVIDQRKQFSAINPLGTWTKLPVAPAKIFDIVTKHVDGRAAGQPDTIKGAINFLNPFLSSRSSMEEWGQFVVDHPVAKFGSVEKKDVHFHGTAPGAGGPKAYVLKRGVNAFQFAPDGTPVKKPAAIAAPAIAAGGSTAAGISTRIVENALTEWRFFEKGTRREGDDPHFRRIGEYWQTVGETFDGRTLIPSGTPGKLINPAWSSAFISHVMKLSGAGDRFEYAQAHAIYVQDFVSGRPNGLYEAMRPENYAPQPGDIVHAGREDAIRMDFDAARAAFKANKRYPSHSDIVVEVKLSEGVLIAIGGNVSQSVKHKRLKLNADGTLSTTRPWIAVLKCLA
jgi:hypothetical protein